MAALTCMQVIQDKPLKRCGKPAELWIGLGATLCYECGERAARIASAAWGIPPHEDETEGS